MPIESGQDLLHYRLIEKVGEGGMGVVWKARDTALDREVAIKILPEAFAQDRERLVRFEREAKLLASLNHAHIATVHGLHEAAGVRFLAMEMVDGEDLAERLGRGAVPLDEALEIARQVSEALEAAHDQGVIHRDLKPANIKLSTDGKAKVLDFGLAKSFEIDPRSSSPGGSTTMSPTLTQAGTQAGVILGTAAYMSPEQARARPVDKRADIWAFGCVLYEMLTGRQAFSGETTTDLLASVVKEEPRWDLLPDETPRRVRELLRKCLVKDLTNRWRDAGDARLELASAMTEPEIAPVVAASPGFAWMAAAALAGVGLASAGWWMATGLGSATTPSAVTRLSIPLPDGLHAEGRIRISPDGRVVAIRAVGRPGSNDPGARLLIRPLDASLARTVPDSDGVTLFDFSPDGDWLAFVAPIARQSSRLRIYKTPVAGDRPPLAIADWDPAWQSATQGLVWLPDGDILVLARPPERVIRISADSGEIKPAVAIAESAEGNLSLESALPDGAVLAYRATWEGGYKVDPVILDPDTGEVTVVMQNGTRSVYSSTGHIVFSRHDQLLAAPFDRAGKKILSGPTSIVDGLRADAYSFEAWFDLASDGTLVHLPGGRSGARRRLIIVDGSDVRSWSDDEPSFPEGTPIEASADGRWLALTRMNEDGLFEIWGSEIARPSLRRFAGFPTLDCSSPRWSGDATLLVFSCTGGSGVAGGLYLLRPEEAKEPRLFFENTPGEPGLNPLAISPKGTELIVRKGDTSGNEIFAISLHEGAPTEPRRLLSGSGALGGAWIANSGSKLAYVSNESGSFEVFVRSRRRDGSLGVAVPVSSGSSVEWRSRSDGADELYVLTDSDEILKFTIADDMTPSEPVPVSFGTPELQSRILSWDILPDGTMLAAITGEDERPPRNISVVLGFATEIGRLVPVE